MDDLISRQAVIDALETVGYDFSDSGLSEIELEEVCEAVGDVRQDMISRIKRLPSAQAEPITVNLDHELTQEEYEKLRKDMANAPIMLLPSAQPERKKGEWIPVMEKLPEKDGKYLVYAVMSCTPDHVDESCEYQQIAIASFLSGKYDSDFYGNNLEKVIAWMPLPELYKEKE